MKFDELVDWPCIRLKHDPFDAVQYSINRKFNSKDIKIEKYELGTRSENYVFKLDGETVIAKKYSDDLNIEKAIELFEFKYSIKNKGARIRGPSPFFSPRNSFVQMSNGSYLGLLEYIESDQSEKTTLSYFNEVKYLHSIANASEKYLSLESYWCSNLDLLQNDSVVEELLDLFNKIFEGDDIERILLHILKTKSSELSFCHGDLHFGNFIRCNRGLAIIDFENIRYDILGNEIDLGTILHRRARSLFNCKSFGRDQLEQFLFVETGLSKSENVIYLLELAMLESLKKIYSLITAPPRYSKKDIGKMLHNHKAYCRDNLKMVRLLKS